MNLNSHSLAVNVSDVIHALDGENRVALYAFNLHKDQTYSDLPYFFHLKAVARVGLEYHECLSEEEAFIGALAIWLHDSLEDCNISYNDLKELAGFRVADVVYNVTNELGKNRKERAQRTYPKIRSCKISTWVKLCDRIANMRFSYATGSSMFRKYQEEHEEFFEELYQKEHGLDQMWDELSTLSKLKKGT